MNILFLFCQLYCRNTDELKDDIADILHVMNSVYAAADAKKITALVGLDISAAFDTIDHDVLASRLESQFGVVGAASGWLRSYLRGRQQFVRLGRHSSS